MRRAFLLLFSVFVLPLTIFAQDNTNTGAAQPSTDSATHKNDPVKAAVFCSGGSMFVLYNSKGQTFRYIMKQTDINYQMLAESYLPTSSFSGINTPFGVTVGGGIELKRAGNHAFSHIVELNYSQYNAHFTFDTNTSFVGLDGTESSSANTVVSGSYKLQAVSAGYTCQAGSENIFFLFGAGANLNFVQFSANVNTTSKYSLYNPYAPSKYDTVWTHYSYSHVSQNMSFWRGYIQLGMGAVAKIKTTAIKTKLYFNIYPGQGCVAAGLEFNVFHIPRRFYE